MDVVVVRVLLSVGLCCQRIFTGVHTFSVTFFVLVLGCAVRCYVKLLDTLMVPCIA